MHKKRIMQELRDKHKGANSCIPAPTKGFIYACERAKGEIAPATAENGRGYGH